MTTVSTLLSTFFLPLNLFVYSKAAYAGQQTASGESVLTSIDFGGIFISLAIVIAAIGTGIFCSWKIDTEQWHKVAYVGGNVSGITLIAWSTFLSFYPYDDGQPTADEVIEEPQESIYYIAIILPCILGLIIASGIATAIRLEKPERLTTAVECCYQNTGIATSAAFSLFSDDPKQLSEAMLVPVIYGLVEAVAIGLYLVIFWKLGWTKAPSDENLCVVVAKSYEIVHVPQEEKEEIEDGEHVNSEEKESDNFDEHGGSSKMSEIVGVGESDKFDEYGGSSKTSEMVEAGEMIADGVKQSGAS